MAGLTDISVDIPEKEITSVKIICRLSNLEVDRSDDDTAHIVCRNVPEDSCVQAADGILNVEVKRPSLGNIIFKDPFKSTSCRVSLPEKLYDSFSAEISTGNGQISDIGCDSAEIISGSGNISIDNVKALKSFRIESGAGNIDIDRLESGPLKIRSGAGNVKVRGTTGGLDIQGGTGNIDHEGSVNGDIDIKGGVGNIDVRLHDSPELHNGKYKLKTANGIGKVNIEYI